MRVLDLFSGIGGFSLGLERAGMRTVAFSEVDPFCQRVLERHWNGVPQLGDVRRITAYRLSALGIEPNVIAAGFPCQDISVANTAGQGIAGARSGLWRECARLVRELRPWRVILENVSALLDRGLGEVLGDLAALGYDAEWHCIPATHLGAPHRRDRIWIVAHPHGQGLEGSEPLQRLLVSEIKALAQHGYPLAHTWDALDQGDGTCRDGDGIPLWLERQRLRSLGNSLVPQIAEIIGRAIMRAEHDRR